MKTDTLQMDTDLLLSVLSFSEAYEDAEHAEQIRKHWRKVARKNKIRIQTFDNTHSREVIIIRKSVMPYDQYLEDAALADAAAKLSRYLDGLDT